MNAPISADVLERILALPEAFRLSMNAGRDVSLLALVQSTGYLRCRRQIDVSVIKSGLRRRDDIVKTWLRYSAGKAANWGWFFEADDRGHYTVGLKTGYSDKTCGDMADAGEACALFIKQELEAILGDARDDPRSGASSNNSCR